MNRTYIQYIGILGGAALVGGVLFFTFSSSCRTIGSLRPVMGSQGYSVYTNDIFKSFEHAGRPVCIPDGWVPVGATRVEGTEAWYPVGKTGVLIRQDSFASRTVRPDGSRYELTILYPLETKKDDIARTLDLVTRTFSSTARLFDDIPKAERVPHTVLSTVGVAGDTVALDTRVYPDPSALLTIVMRAPETERAEGLVIHAAVHLYNRFALESPYTDAQAPFSAEEFEELEATWAEVALSRTPGGAADRLMYLYRVHSAVVTQNYALTTEPPFTDADAFAEIVPTVFVRGSKNYLDYQYGHYVLLPLSLAAVDALLYERRTGLTVERILRDIHAGKRGNFMNVLSEVLPSKDYANVGRWLRGDAQVPIALIESAIRIYDRTER